MCLVQRAPTGDEYVVVFNVNNAASGLPFETKGILQLNDGTCPAPPNEFETKEYTFTLGVEASWGQRPVGV